MTLIRLSEGAAFSFDSAEGSRSKEWAHGISADGTTLLSLDVEAFVLHRFVLP